MFDWRRLIGKRVKARACIVHTVCEAGGPSGRQSEAAE